MSTRFELQIRSASGIQTGPAAPAHDEAAKGSPVLAASALRGALRQSLEAVLRGAGEPACSGGDGIEPGSADTRAGAGRDSACALDAGAPCKACRLFGSARSGLADGASHPVALVLESARSDAPPRGARRGGIALRRADRTSAQGRHYEQRVAELPGGLIASGRLRDPALAPLLEAAVRATAHVGAGRSRGLGRVQLELRWLEGEPITRPADPPDPDVWGIRVRLLSPAAIGTPEPQDGARTTRAEIPGSALRGAVGFALAQLPGVTDDPAFRALVDEQGGARFGFLYPVRATGTRAARRRTPVVSYASGRHDGAADSPAQAGSAGAFLPPLAAPWPVTARICSAAGLRHGLVDTLLDRVRTACAQTPEQTEQAWSARTGSCPVCGEELIAPPGSRRCSEPPHTRLQARARIDRAGDALRAGGRSTDELLDPRDAIAFEGEIRGVPQAARELLARALGGPLSLGRGAAHGLGHVQVEVLAPAAWPALAVRAEAFERALASHLAALGWDSAAAAEIAPITLLSPLLAGADSDGREELAHALGGNVQWLVAARRIVAEGSWDQRTGTPFRAFATAGGAVFAARLPGGWRARIAALEQLERDGAGARRHQGHGQLLCFDPFSWERPSGETPG